VAKLIRNDIPAIAEESGQRMNAVGAPSYTHWWWLLRKLTEEVEELVDAVGEDGILEEMADVYEVIRAMAERMHLNMTAVESRAAAKRHEKGSFSYMLIWDEES
jgi:predicted house-cleaning noncanonical NTP pyrophosphatase (MazG superfamily)